jgi:hypothetical protein
MSSIFSKTRPKWLAMSRIAPEKAASINEFCLLLIFHNHNCKTGTVLLNYIRNLILELDVHSTYLLLVLYSVAVLNV